MRRTLLDDMVKLSAYSEDLYTGGCVSRGYHSLSESRIRELFKRRKYVKPEHVLALNESPENVLYLLTDTKLFSRTELWILTLNMLQDVSDIYNEVDTEGVIDSTINTVRDHLTDTKLCNLNKVRYAALTSVGDFLELREKEIKKRTSSRKASFTWMISCKLHDIIASIIRGANPLQDLKKVSDYICETPMDTSVQGSRYEAFVSHNLIEGSLRKRQVEVVKTFLSKNISYPDKPYQPEKSFRVSENYVITDITCWKRGRRNGIQEHIKIQVSNPLCDDRLSAEIAEVIAKALNKHYKMKEVK